MRLAVFRFAWLCFGAAALGLAGGFAGALHPAGDSLAVFRLHFATVAVLAALLAALSDTRRRRSALLAALAAAALGAPAALSYVPRPGPLSAAPAAPQALVIYQKNLLFRLSDPGPIVEDILASGAEVVTLQEVSERNLAVLAALRLAFPAQAYCPAGEVGGVAVLSRWPALGAPICAEDDGLVALRLDAPQGPLWAVSLHVHWPWPHSQADHVARLLPLIAALDGPVLIGGDFNMVPWGASVRRIAAAARAEKAGPTATTLVRGGGWARLPIDHVLLPRGWTATQTIRPRLGSDHSGVLVRAGR